MVQINQFEGKGGLISEDILDLVQSLLNMKEIGVLMPWPFTGRKMVWAGANFFAPDQKFIYILWQSQTFFARQKDDLHSVKLVFVPAQKFLKRH